MLDLSSMIGKLHLKWKVEMLLFIYFYYLKLLPALAIIIFKDQSFGA